MEWIVQYLLSVIGAAILCAAVKSFLGNKGTASTTVKVMTGLFLAITIIAPWSDFSVDDISAYLNQSNVDSSEAVAVGTQLSQEAISDAVRENIKAHILDKAAYLEMSITVQVVVGTEYPPIPESVTITGSVSPYAKSVLSQYMEDELGIPKEHQIWT